MPLTATERSRERMPSIASHNQSDAEGFRYAILNQKHSFFHKVIWSHLPVNVLINIEELLPVKPLTSRTHMLVDAMMDFLRSLAFLSSSLEERT